MYCKECGTEITEKGEVCQNCGETLNNTKSKSTTTAAVLSMIWPGLGQVYNGQIVKGVGFWIVCLIGWMISPVLGIIVWACGLWDAYGVAKGTQSGITEEKKDTSISVTFVKGFFYSVVILFGLMCIGAFIFGMGEGVSEVSTTSTASTPKVAPTQEPDVKDKITLTYNGREEHIKCKVLLVASDHNTVFIENDDIETITILGDGNMIAYPSGANPEVRDLGNYNRAWGSIWL